MKYPAIVEFASKADVAVLPGALTPLTSTSTHWEAFVGFTYLLPHRLW